jgi:hypothetical protein
VHAHANGDALKGLALALIAELLNLVREDAASLRSMPARFSATFPGSGVAGSFPCIGCCSRFRGAIICNSDIVRACIAGYGIRRRKIVAIPAFSRQYLEFTPAPLPERVDAFLRRYPNTVFTYVRMRPLFYPITLIEGMGAVLSRRSDTGLLICGMAGSCRRRCPAGFERAIEEQGNRGIGSVSLMISITMPS